jgi:hypothetical protein
MKILLIILLGINIAGPVYAQSKRKEKIIYKYKKYEKFDFEDLVIEGESGSPGDLTIAPRYQRKFKNRLPYRKNFNAEIRKGIERIR